jgi:hypothetical protein
MAGVLCLSVSLVAIAVEGFLSNEDQNFHKMKEEGTAIGAVTG